MDEKVAGRVREFRKAAGLTQEDLAGAMEVSRQTIISIEKGKYVPSLQLALKLARYFGCGTDEMFSLVED